MELGWIDFSKSEREKILNVLDLLTELGVLDELGIAPIRDRFSDLFFPGTSTIQTRAKYFFIVPYALKDLELNNEKSFSKLKRNLDDTEEKCARTLLDINFHERGIIGRRSIAANKWVKRTPASIYWAGLRKYQIFRANISIDQYIKIIAFQKQKKSNILKLGNNEDNEEEHDDKNAGVGQKVHFLNIPSYNPKWKNEFDMNLTPEEGQFLKSQIISSCGDSMMVHILKDNMYEILEYASFRDLKGIIGKFPEKIQKDYYRARSFSEFIFVLRVIYNLIVSEGENETAKKEFASLKPDLSNFAQVDIEEIFASLKIYNPHLRTFLIKSRDLMKNEDYEGLKNIIKSRELMLKGQNRSKTAHPGEFDKDLWFAGGYLDYRFNNAKNIIRDIFESETPDIVEKYVLEDNGSKMEGL
ncbi:DUF6361 family protein [uncultured Methanobrevibacter sp.]|uniref:DUF6361 family protein n=1 Tax=uncultured Methanobrevibacter sp. TaxID=253161 RepID=UPI0025F29F60|nr:DUF6361 family protein [uncultured Methanobrevibacter sp.]